jgi:glycine/D-amino acid oxidase-like deaminating enzyme
MATSYDYIVVGSGLAGLYAACHLAAKKRVCIVEKYEELGGRASTFHQDISGVHIQWEAGAGRISTKHSLVRQLMRKYKLTWIPIGGDIDYEGYASTPPKFEDGFPVFFDPIASLPKEDLATHTLRELLTKIHGAEKTEAYLLTFPYRGEVDTLRADLALKTFRHEMGPVESYGICKEGISAIVEGLRKEFEEKGGVIQRKHTCVEVAQADKKSPIKVSCMVDNTPVVLEASRCILAVPVEALKKIKPFEKWATVRHLKMTPLLRFYGVFPKTWADRRMVTPPPIRYMIPGNPAIGTMQMSYTESQDAEYWKRKLDSVGEKAVGEEILAELRKITPTIPPPSLVRAHYWTEGVTYWLPGAYDPVEESRGAYRPFPEMPAIHVCGESFSMRQAWMEGALEHADGLLRFLKTHQ